MERATILRTWACLQAHFPYKPISISCVHPPFERQPIHRAGHISDCPWTSSIMKKLQSLQLPHPFQLHRWLKSLIQLRHTPLWPMRPPAICGDHHKMAFISAPAPMNASSVAINPHRRPTILLRSGLSIQMGPIYDQNALCGVGSLPSRLFCTLWFCQVTVDVSSHWFSVWIFHRRSNILGVIR